MIHEVLFSIFVWTILVTSAVLWQERQYDQTNENRLAVQIGELDEAFEAYAKAHYATLRQCAGVSNPSPDGLSDGGVTREIDIPIWSIPALRDSIPSSQRDKNKAIPAFLSSSSTYSFLNTAARPPNDTDPRHHDCVNKIDHNRDGDITDIGENYPISLEEAGLLPLWLSVGGENPDRYGSSLGFGLLSSRGSTSSDSDKRLLALQAEAKGRFGLIVRPIFRFVDGDPIEDSLIPVIQILAGVIQIPDLDEDTQITTQTGLAAAAVKSGSSGVGILSRSSGNLVIGIGDSWRLGIGGEETLDPDAPTPAPGDSPATILRPTVWNSVLLCFRMVAPRPSTDDINDQNYCKSDGSVNSGFQSHEIANFYPHAAGRGDEFTAASLVLLHTISDHSYQDTSLSRVDTGIPGLNRMQTGIDMAGFGFNNVAYIIAPDANNDGEPEDPLVIIGPKSDRRPAGDRVPPITLVGDFHVTGELTVGDGLRVADLGREVDQAGAYVRDLRTDVSGGRFVSLLDQIADYPAPVSYAQLDAAVPRIAVPTDVNQNSPEYGQGWLPMSGIPGVQIASGVHLGGELTGVGGVRIAGPRVGLVAESAYADEQPPVQNPGDPLVPHGLGQDWAEFNEQGHSPDQIIAGNFSDAAYRPGAFDNDPANPLQRLKSVDHYRDPTGKFGFVNGQLRFIGRNGAILAGSGQNGVSIWATDGDARVVAGQNVRSDLDDTTHRGSTGADGPLVAQTHTQSGNVILHNSDSTQASGGILLDPDQVILINDDVAAVETRGRGRNPEAIYALADRVANPDKRPNLQYVDDGDGSGDLTREIREILPGIGLYDETRYALHDPVGTGEPWASRFEGRPLASAFPRLVLNQIEFADSNQPSGISAVGGSSTVTFQHPRNVISADPDVVPLTPAAVALDDTRIRTGATQIPVLDPVTGGYDSAVRNCPGGGFAQYQVVPTSWRQPDYVEVRNTQTLAFNLGVGGTVTAPQYAGTSAVNLEFTTVLPYLGWGVDPVTGRDSSTYGDSSGTDIDIPDDGSAETEFSVIWYCRY